MRYATLADAEPGARPTCRPDGSFELSSGEFWPEGRTAVVATRTKLQIFTLGRFGLSIFGHAVQANGKAKHRPIVLLQALVALGGRDIACSRLWEHLWPDSEGDLGRRNLNITVHRLRQMLRAPDAVNQHNGKLTLNAQLCWVDVWDFERKANGGLESLCHAGAANGALVDLRGALALYAGHFLARESEEAWMLAPRLRLKTKFERLVCALSSHLEQQRQFGEAIDVCRQALELDPLNELFYRRLIRCYLERGEIASALVTYRRCREALVKGLSAPVSGETQRLYAEALRAAEGGIAQSDKFLPATLPR
jgi:LuxR family transcriptional regulator, maltose regulon positive regulatory protein